MDVPTVVLTHRRPEGRPNDENFDVGGQMARQA